MTDNPLYLTTDEVAEILRVKPQTLRAWRCARRGPRSFAAGGRVLYAKSDVLAFVEAALAGDGHDAA